MHKLHSPTYPLFHLLIILAAALLVGIYSYDYYRTSHQSGNSTIISSPSPIPKSTASPEISADTISSPTPVLSSESSAESVSTKIITPEESLAKTLAYYDPDSSYPSVTQFDNYWFFTWENYISRLPIGAETHPEQIEQLITLDDDKWGDFAFFYTINDNLFIYQGNPDSYHESATIYSLTNATSQPDKIIDRQAFGIFSVIPTHSDLFYLKFSTGDVCAIWGRLWAWSPSWPEAKLVSTLGDGCYVGNHYLGITNDDRILLGVLPSEITSYQGFESLDDQYPSLYYHTSIASPKVTEIVSLQINPLTGDTDIQPILGREHLINLWAAPFYSQTDNLIYLPGSTVTAYDPDAGTTRTVFDWQAEMNKYQIDTDYDEYHVISSQDYQACFIHNSLYLLVDLRTHQIEKVEKYDDCYNTIHPE